MSDKNYFLEYCSRLYLNKLMKSIGKLLLQPSNWKHQLDLIQLNWNMLKLANTPRYTPSYIKLFDSKVKILDSMSFLGMYQEIFERQIYKFKTQNQTPKIIDGGSNIGISIIYFKQFYPNSHIIAFEPDERIFNCLKINVEEFKLSKVELFNKALWTSETFLEFMSEGVESGRLGNIEPERERYKVPTVRLRNFLDKPVDLLKLDIEGAETAVIKDCADLLFNVKNLFVEYHSFVNEPQSLNVLINILSEAGFRLHIHTSGSSPQPFLVRNTNLGMDLQLNIFAFRE